MSERRAWGFGLATVSRPEDPEAADASGSVLDTWFPTPALGPAPVDAALGRDPDPYAVPAALADLAVADPDRGVVTEVVLTDIDLDAAPQDASDAYLRLHLLSHRLAEPNSLNLNGIFGVLANVVWTDRGPCSVEEFERARLRMRLRARGPVQVLGVDKFPRMTDYVVPSGVRIADADRVRLGAHLAAGTTVMHEGFVNFNAGTLGTSMVEGRIGQGIVVDDGSDIGGGASIMGTLSGGGTQRIRIGKRCLLGAEAGLGISLGDDCVVEAGLYVTAGTKLAYHDGGSQPRTLKALELSGRPGLLYRRNSMTGAVEALHREGLGIELNSALHAN